MKSRTWQQFLVGSAGLALAACWLEAGRLGAEERVFDNNFAEVAAVVEEMRGISMQEPAMAQNQSTPESRRRDRIYAMLRAFGTNAVPAVAAALSDPDVGMRRNAALVLIDLNAP